MALASPGGRHKDANGCSSTFQGVVMKRSLILAVISFCLMTVVPISGVRASPEQYSEEHCKCIGYTKRFCTWWHLHANEGKPEQHHKKSSTVFGTYSHYPPSPYYQKYDWCTNYLPYTNWYWLLDCLVGGIDCRSHGIIPVTYESTYPQPCLVP